MIQLFSRPWSQVHTCWIDTETTGVRPGIDKAVQIGIVRFEDGLPVAHFDSLVCPGIPIPETATAIHGITDEMVRDAVDVNSLFRTAAVLELLDGAQPAAYNAFYDRSMVPPFGEEPSWPWLDSLSMVRVIDRFERGKGRHKLENAAARHGVQLSKAHDAPSDARAAGELFYKLAPTKFGPAVPLGDVIRWQRLNEIEEWHRFSEWRAKQHPPPKENANAHG